MCKPHPKCRPPQASGTTLRLGDNGQWARDNGDPGLAFVGVASSPDDALLWVANCDCKIYLKCPVSKAFAFAADRYSTAMVVRRRPSPSVRKPRKIRRRSKR